MEDIPLNSRLYLVGNGGAADEIELEIRSKRTDLEFVRIIPDGEKITRVFIPESEFLEIKDEVLVVLSVGNPKLRRKIFNIYSSNSNIVFPNIILTKTHNPKNIGKGNIFLPGVRITSNILIGDFNYFNYGCFIAHNTSIGCYNTISPFSLISGYSRLYDENFLSTGVILNPNVVLSNVTVSSGTVVREGSYNSAIIAQDFGKTYDKK